METKIPAFPILEPLSKATQTALAPLKLLPTDFLEIDIDEKEWVDDKKGQHFLVQAVCLKKCPTNALPSMDDAATPSYVQTPEGSFYIDPAHYHYPSYNASSVWFRRIPERSQKGFGFWRLAGTDYTALVIHHAWPHHKLIFKSEEAQLLYTYLLTRFFAQSKSATIAAEFKLNGIAPEMPKDFIEHSKLPLTDYQKTALLISLHNNAYSLFMEQGTGKTPIVINKICLEAARKRAAGKGMYRALIICPQQVRLNWEREFVRFATVPGKTCILRGGNLQKIRRLIDAVRDESDCAWSACIISIDSVNSIWEALKKLKWDLAVIDESHKIKNSSTNRFKNLMLLDDAHAKSKMILTGTPITNTIFDIWAQWEWLGKGLGGFSTYNNFRSFHGKWEQRMQGGTGVAKLVGFKNTPLIQERLARLSFLFRKDDIKELIKLKYPGVAVEDLPPKVRAMLLPEKVSDIYEVAMVAKQMEIYKKVATQLVAEIDEILETAEEKGTQNITVEHILTKLIRLAQICSGHIKLDDEVDMLDEVVRPGAVIQISQNNPKVEAIVKMIREDWENDPNSKCVIWASFVEDIRVVSERLAAEGINHVGYHRALQSKYRVKDSAAAEDVINFDDNCRVLVAHPASGGIGQNYLGYDVNHPEKSDMYVNHHIYFSRNWSAVDRIQSEDRSHRRGTRTNLRITDLMIPYTIDQEIRERVTAKRAMAMSIQDIRNILNNVLKGYRK